MNHQYGLHIFGISTDCRGQDIPSGPMIYQLRNGWILAYSEMKWKGWIDILSHLYYDKSRGKENKPHERIGYDEKGHPRYDKQSDERPFQDCSDHIRSIAQL